MPEAVLHLSSLTGSPLLDFSGERLGRVEDLIARLDTGNQLPPVTGLKARIGGRVLFVPANRIARLEPQAARTSTTKLNLAQFERRPGEVLLRADVLGRSMINVATARLVRAREVELVCEPDASITSLIETAVPTVAPETELPEVARLMADFNLLAIPVIDSDDQPIGVVAFDDVLELLLPDEWRRRAGAARG